MDDAWRERRLAELRGLQTSNPRQIIEKYRAIVGEPTSNQLPYGVSFSRMIDTIVSHEGRSEKSSVATN